MGLNAYFTYTVVGYHGSGKVPYETALAAVFIEGLIFLVLSILGIRQWLTRLIPMSIKVAMGCGIGLYLCFIGVQSSAGIGLVSLDLSTLVTLGGCPAAAKNANGVCQWGHMESPTLYMGLLGLVIISILLMYRVRGAILIGIIFIAITSWPRVSQVTYFPYTPEGDASFDYFKKVVNVHHMNDVLGKFNFDLSGSQFWIALITFLVSITKKNKRKKKSGVILNTKPNFIIIIDSMWIFLIQLVPCTLWLVMVALLMHLVTLNIPLVLLWLMLRVFPLGLVSEARRVLRLSNPVLVLRKGVVLGLLLSLSLLDL